MKKKNYISAEARRFYRTKTDNFQGITLKDIAEQSHCDYGDFSSKFKRIRCLFAIDDGFFTRKGSKASYAFTYDEAVFLHELCIREHIIKYGKK